MVPTGRCSAAFNEAGSIHASSMIGRFTSRGPGFLNYHVLHAKFLTDNDQGRFRLRD